MPSEYIRTNLKKQNSQVFSDVLKDEYEVTPTISGADKAYKLTEGTLNVGKKETYKLRVWMDKSVTAEDTDSMNAVFKAKISIVFSPTKDPFAESGTLQSLYYGYSQGLWAYKANITEVEFQNKMEPIEGALYSWDVSSNDDGSVMAYLVNDGSTYKAYIQGKGGVRANPNSSYLFADFKNLNKINGLEYFDTSKVTNMSNMFYQTGYQSDNLNLDLNSFVTMNVTDMSLMFYGTGYNASEFTLDVSSFNTSNVTNMSYMFCDAGYNNPNFELDVRNFDTSNVTDMSGMFLATGYNNSNFELDVSGFDTSKVTDMSYMFEFVGYNNPNFQLDVSNFDTSNVTNMWGMFSGTGYYSSNFNLNISSFDTSKVTNMAEMFSTTGSYSENFTLDLSNFDTSNVTSMWGMFNGTAFYSNQFNLNVSSFDTSKVVNMAAMFSNLCPNILSKQLDISNFDTSNVNNMSGMFSVTIGSVTYDEPIKIITSNLFNLDKINNFYQMYTPFGGMFENASYIDMEIKIQGLQQLSSNNYINMFKGAATIPGSKILINYISESEALVDLLIATKSYNSNIIKGSTLPNYNISLDSSYDDLVSLNFTTAYEGKNIILTSINTDRIITSFKINGNVVQGNSFKMLGTDVEITDIEFYDPIIVESQHNDYLNNENYTVYYENTFEDATSITVILTYQTESTSYDWVYLYTDEDTIYQNKKYGNTTLTTETITIPSDYLKIVFRTDSSVCNYYGFKALIIPNYD